MHPLSFPESCRNPCFAARRLLNHHRLRSRGNLLPPFDFLIALVVGFALTRGDFIEHAASLPSSRVSIAKALRERRARRYS